MFLVNKLNLKIKEKHLFQFKKLIQYELQHMMANKLSTELLNQSKFAVLNKTQKDMNISGVNYLTSNASSLNPSSQIIELSNKGDQHSKTQNKNATLKLFQFNQTISMINKNISILFFCLIVVVIAAIYLLIMP